MITEFFNSAYDLTLAFVAESYILSIVLAFGLLVVFSSIINASRVK